MRNHKQSLFWSLLRGTILLLLAYGLFGGKMLHHLGQQGERNGEGEKTCIFKKMMKKMHKKSDHKKFQGAMHQKIADVGTSMKKSYSNTNPLPTWLDFMREERYMEVCMPEGSSRNDIVTREDAIPCLARFAAKMDLEKDKDAVCTFTDLEDIPENLQDKAILLCETGLLRGENSNFKPFSPMNQAEMLAILVRSINGYMNENESPWFKKYYEYAVSMGWVKSGLSEEVFAQGLTRQDLGLWIYQSTQNTGAYSIINN